MSIKNRLQFKTILVATDLTHSGSCALRYAKRLAQLHGSKLVIGAATWERILGNQQTQREALCQKDFLSSTLS